MRRRGSSTSTASCRSTCCSSSTRSTSSPTSRRCWRCGSAASSIASIKLTLTLEGPDAVEGQGRRAAEAVLVPDRQDPLQQDVRRDAQHHAAGSRWCCRCVVAGARGARQLGRRAAAAIGIGSRACASCPSVPPSRVRRASGRHARRSARRSCRSTSPSIASGQSAARRCAHVSRSPTVHGERRRAGTPPPAQESFAPAQFFDMTDDEKLASPSFKTVRQRHPRGRRRAAAHRLRRRARSASTSSSTSTRSAISGSRAASRGPVRRRRRAPSTPGRLQGAIAKSELSFARRRKSALRARRGRRRGRSRSRSCTPSDLRAVRRRQRRSAPSAPRCSAATALIAANPALRGCAAGRAGVRDERMRRQLRTIHGHASQLHLPPLDAARHRAEIAAPDDLGVAAAPAPSAPRSSVSFNDQRPSRLQRRCEVLGPGDVVGINPRAIVKTEPRNWVTDFESNYLPYIEFYEEDFPWRFTPATRGERARRRAGCGRGSSSWCSRKASSPSTSAAGRLPVVRDQGSVSIPRRSFRRPEQTWAWAHVHVSQNIIGNTLQTTDRAGGVAASSRTLEQTARRSTPTSRRRACCARASSKKNTAYHAFVIPAFEAGRLAGLGLDIPRGHQRAARLVGRRSAPVSDLLPLVLPHRREQGDFEFLVDLLEPRPVGQARRRALDGHAEPRLRSRGHVRPAARDGPRRRVEEPGDGVVAGAVAARRNRLRQSACRVGRALPERARTEGQPAVRPAAGGDRATIRIPIRSSARRSTASGTRWPSGSTCSKARAG